MADTLRAFTDAAASPSADERLAALSDLASQLESLRLDGVDPPLFELAVDALARAAKAPQPKHAQTALECIALLAACIADTSPTAIFHLRVAAAALAPAAVERMADSRDATRDRATAAAVELARAAHSLAAAHDLAERSSAASGGDAAAAAAAANPFAAAAALVDKEIRTNAFGSKAARAREHGVMWLLQCAQSLRDFGLKQWVPALVRLLEDTNEGVRAVSRDAVVRLFNSIHNKAMRADIRRELAKQQIRQAIVDAITAQLRDDADAADAPSPRSASQSVEQPASAKAPRAVEPRQAAAAPAAAASSGGTAAADPDPIMLAGSHELDSECAQIVQAFAGKETEDNWGQREATLQRLRGILRGNAPSLDGFAASLRTVADPVCKTLHSLRTALVMTSCSVVVDIAAASPASAIDGVVELLVSNLLKAAAASKKLIASAVSHACKAVLLRACDGGAVPAKAMPHLLTAIGDKSQSVRLAAAESLRLLVERLVESASASSAPPAAVLDGIDKALRKGLKDAAAPVREACRDSLAHLRAAWPDRAERLIDSMDADVRKAMARHKRPAPTVVALPTLGGGASTPSIAQRPATAQPQQQPQPQRPKAHAEPRPAKNDAAVPPRRQDAAPAARKPEQSREDGVVAQLQSDRHGERLLGLFGLLDVIQEAQAPRGRGSSGVKPETVTAVRAALVGMLAGLGGAAADDGSTSELAQSLLDIGNLQILVDGGVLRLGDVLVPVLRLAGGAAVVPELTGSARAIASALSPATLAKTRGAAAGVASGSGAAADVQALAFKLARHLVSATPVRELAGAVAELINPFAGAASRFRRFGAGGGGAQGDAAVPGAVPSKADTVALVHLLEALLSSQGSGDSDGETAAVGGLLADDDALARQLLNKLVPLASGSRAMPAAAPSALRILQRVHAAARGVFDRALGTFDVDLAASVRADLGIQDDDASDSRADDNDSGDVDEPSGSTPRRQHSLDAAGISAVVQSPPATQVADKATAAISATQHDDEDAADMLPDGASDVLNETLPPGFADESVLWLSSAQQSSALGSRLLGAAATQHRSELGNNDSDGSGTQDDIDDLDIMSDLDDAGDARDRSMLSVASRRSGATTTEVHQASPHTSTPRTALRQLSSVLSPIGRARHTPRVASPSQSQSPVSQAAASRGSPQAGMVGAAPALGSLERLVDGGVTPVRPGQLRSRTGDQLLKDGTPAAKQAAGGGDELEQLVRQLRDGAGIDSTLRRLARLSRRDGDARMRGASKDWARWMAEIVPALAAVIDAADSPDDLQERCLLLLGELVQNQDAFFGGLESDVLRVLLDCRSDASAAVAGSADDSLARATEHLDRDGCFAALVRMLQQWDLQGSGGDAARGAGRSLRRRDGASRAASHATRSAFQPMPAASALVFLGRLVGTRFSADEIDRSRRVDDVMAIAVRAINSDSAEIRKASVDCLVEAAQALGDRLWRHVNPMFSEAQCKLLGVFVARSKRRHVASL
ncbi:suppressor of tub2 mutation [Polyrhizophydium stewartii]|uniref:Suppressor of tub2 mutation n=1 Tax=Polyrhizophydium stewartii TaxID=2732419 RepID=A0ABR4NH73_9FUNG